MSSRDLGVNGPSARYPMGRRTIRRQIFGLGRTSARRLEPSLKRKVLERSVPTHTVHPPRHNWELVAQTAAEPSLKMAAEKLSAISRVVVGGSARAGSAPPHRGPKWRCCSSQRCCSRMYAPTSTSRAPPSMSPTLAAIGIAARFAPKMTRCCAAQRGTATER